MQGNDLHLDFFQLIDTIKMKAGRQKLLRISKEVDNYSDIILCWNSKAKCISFYDMEHKELGNMCSFEDFIKEPAIYLQKIIDGEY